jgi:O-antigen ligase
MALIQAALAGLIALIIAPGWSFYFDITPKAVVLLAGVAVLLCGAVFRPAPHPKTLSLLFLAAAVSLAASTAFSTNRALSLYGTNWRRYGAAVQVALLLYAWILACHPERTRALLRSISIAALIAALYGIAQYFGWDPLLPAAGYHVGDGIWTIVRPPGTMGYVSYFATWLVIAAFLSFGLAGLESGLWRWSARASGSIALIAMSLTGTRAALLGLAAGAVVWFLGRGRRPAGSLAWRAGVIAVAAVAFYFSPAGGALRSRSRWYTEDRWGGARPLLWRDSLRMGLARPGLGYGPEVFAASFPHFESRELARAYPDFAHESPHNMFLDALVGQGVPGLAALIAICGAGLMWAWRNRNPWLAGALAAGITSQQFTVFTVPTAMLFYTCVGLAAVKAERAPQLPRVRWVLAASAAAFLALAVRYTVADHRLELARRSLQAGDVPAASQHYAGYDRWRLPGTSADLWYSQALQSARAPAARVLAGAAALRATKSSEEPFNAWYNLAIVAASHNDVPGTESSLRAAIAAHPNWFKPHWTLAQVLRLQSHIDEAEREAALAAELNSGKNPEVAQTLRQIEQLRIERLHK